MTPEQHRQEAQHAEAWLAQQQQQRDGLGRQVFDAFGDAYRRGGGVEDIHRRVIEEPWYGRTVTDLQWDRASGWYQRNAGQGTVHDTPGGTQSQNQGTGQGAPGNPQGPAGGGGATIHGTGPAGTPPGGTAADAFYGRHSEQGDTGQGRAPGTVHDAPGKDANMDAFYGRQEQAGQGASPDKGQESANMDAFYGRQQQQEPQPGQAQGRGQGMGA